MRHLFSVFGGGRGGGVASNQMLGVRRLELCQEKDAGGSLGEERPGRVDSFVVLSVSRAYRRGLKDDAVEGERAMAHRLERH